MFKKLFEPVNIGRMRVKNRLVMAPMGVGAMQNPGNRFSQRIRDYYEARAKGGVGLIITGSALMTRLTDSENRTNVAMLDNTYVGEASETCDAVHRWGSKICIQFTPGEGSIISWGREQPVAPTEGMKSAFDPNIVSRAATTDEVEAIIRDYEYAAGLAKLAGFDAIEIRAYGGYFTDQFMTAMWNKRTDKYGGNLDGRLRFLMETIEAIRRANGDDYPIIVKFTPDHCFEGGRKLEEGLEIARRLEDAGVAALHVDKGCYENWYFAIPPVHIPLANQIELAERVKKVVDIPVIANGKLGIDPQIAVEIVSQNKTDFIGLGRTLLADPDWPNKIKEGKLRDIKTCIGCMGCMHRMVARKYVSCALTPQTGMEREFTITPAERKKTVLVIGGGPGGMEAARVSAIRGHDVTLCEKRPVLGGAVRYASAPSFKKQMKTLIDYYSVQLANLGVKIECGIEIDADSILKRKADTIIMATGASPIIPENIINEECNNLFTTEKVLLGNVGIHRLGKKTVIVGAGQIGCEVALHLAEQKHDLSITLIEMSEEIASDAFISVKWLLERRLEASGVKTICGTKLLQASDRSITVMNNGSNKKIDADSVILAVGSRSNNQIAEEVEGKLGQGTKLYTIGDCKEPRNILEAIWEGFHVARMF